MGDEACSSTIYACKHLLFHLYVHIIQCLGTMEFPTLPQALLTVTPYFPPKWHQVALPPSYHKYGDYL